MFYKEERQSKHRQEEELEVLDLMDDQNLQIEEDVDTDEVEGTLIPEHFKRGNDEPVPAKTEPKLSHSRKHIENNLFMNHSDSHGSRNSHVKQAESAPVKPNFSSTTTVQSIQKDHHEAQKNITNIIGNANIMINQPQVQVHANEAPKENQPGFVKINISNFIINTNEIPASKVKVSQGEKPEPIAKHGFQ